MTRGSAGKVAARWTSYALLLASLAMPAWAATPMEQLRLARDVLCPRCDNDIEAEGVNRPVRRVMLALGALSEAERGLDAAIAQGATAWRAARPALRQARSALDAMDEPAAHRALGRAVRILEGMRAGG